MSCPVRLQRRLIPGRPRRPRRRQRQAPAPALLGPRLPRHSRQSSAPFCPSAGRLSMPGGGSIVPRSSGSAVSSRVLRVSYALVQLVSSRVCDARSFRTAFSDALVRAVQ
eukprot:7590144-Alexandrium_andersonii.AAC.1